MNKVNVEYLKKKQHLANLKAEQAYHLKYSN